MTDFEKLFSILTKQGVEFIVAGGVAANIHGSARLTNDLDILYKRSEENITRIIKALLEYKPYLRGAPPGLPFTLDLRTIKSGLNFTLTTTIGDIDLLGELIGIGFYENVIQNSQDVAMFGLAVKCLSIGDLIKAKRAAGRPKDLEAISELELILESSLKKE